MIQTSMDKGKEQYAIIQRTNCYIALAKKLRAILGDKLHGKLDKVLHLTFN
jgi:hypothetical protein